MNRLAVFGIVCCLTGFCLVNRYAQAETAKFDPPLIDEMQHLELYPTPQPTLEVLLSKAPDGLHYLSEYKGKIILLNIWATWCPPCIEELPSLNALQMGLGGDDFQVINVALDRDDPGFIKKYMDDHKLTNLIPFIDANYDVQKLDSVKDVAAVPITLILDRKLNVVARLQGGINWDGRGAHTLLEYFIKHLPAAAPPAPSVSAN